jgi:site-specific DNA recombinase
MDELVSMRVNKELTSDSFQKHYKPLEEQWNQIQAELPELQAEIDFLKIQHLSSDVIMREAKDLYNRWPTLPFTEKRGIVETITNKITIGKEDINISLAYIPTTHPSSTNGGKRQHNLMDS